MALLCPLCRAVVDKKAVVKKIIQIEEYSKSNPANYLDKKGMDDLGGETLRIHQPISVNSGPMGQLQ